MKIQVTNIRNGKRDIISEFINIKRRKNIKSSFMQKNLNKIYRLFEAEITKYESKVRLLNCLKTIREIAFAVTKSFLWEKNTVPDDFTGKFHVTSSADIIAILYKLSQRIAENERLCNLFFETFITLTPKPKMLQAREHYCLWK